MSTRNDVENSFWDKLKGVRSVEGFGRGCFYALAQETIVAVAEVVVVV